MVTEIILYVYHVMGTVQKDQWIGNIRHHKAPLSSVMIILNAMVDVYHLVHNVMEQTTRFVLNGIIMIQCTIIIVLKNLCVIQPKI